jgi:hypothetical protein
MATAAHTLPIDVSRCAGRLGLGPDDDTRADRQHCMRFLAIIQSAGEPILAHVATHPRESNATPCLHLISIDRGSD